MAKGEPALEAAFKRLSKSASQLNSASERVNALFEETETRLSDASVGMSVTLPSWVSEGNDNRWDMAFEKYKGAWRIVARRFDPGDEEAPTIQEVLPMVNAPRFVRIAAVAQLPDLVNALAQKAEAAFNGIPTEEESENDDLQASDEDVPF